MTRICIDPERAAAAARTAAVVRDDLQLDAEELLRVVSAGIEGPWALAGILESVVGTALAAVRGCADLAGSTLAELARVAGFDDAAVLPDCGGPAMARVDRWLERDRGFGHALEESLAAPARAAWSIADAYADRVERRAVAVPQGLVSSVDPGDWSLGDLARTLRAVAGGPTVVVTDVAGGAAFDLGRDMATAVAADPTGAARAAAAAVVDLDDLRHGRYGEAAGGLAGNGLLVLLTAGMAATVTAARVAASGAGRGVATAAAGAAARAEIADGARTFPPVAAVRLRSFRALDRADPGGGHLAGELRAQASSRLDGFRTGEPSSLATAVEAIAAARRELADGAAAAGAERDVRDAEGRRCTPAG